MIVPENYGLLSPERFVSYLEKIKGDVLKMQEIYCYETLSDFSEESLIRLLGDAETIDKSLRSCLSDDEISGSGDKKQAIKELGNVPWTDVKAQNYPGAILLLELPPLMARSYKSGRYSVATRLERELKRWARANIAPISLEGNKLLYIYKRYSNKPLVLCCDNDNWEMRRVTNAVSEAICLPDNPRYASFFYTTVYSEFNGAELMLILEKDLPKFLDYINSRVPACNKTED